MTGLEYERLSEPLMTLPRLLVVAHVHLVGVVVLADVGTSKALSQLVHVVTGDRLHPLLGHRGLVDSQLDLLELLLVGDHELIQAALGDGGDRLLAPWR